MLIDAHQHFWSVARADYRWLTPELPELYRDFGPSDLSPHLTRWSITGTVLVQAAETEAETAFLLDIATRHPKLVRGVVGWVDLMAPDADARVARMARNPALCALRPMIQDIPDTNWMLSPALRPGLQAMSKLGLRFDALIRPQHLPVLRTFVDLYPDLHIVVDHGAKPEIARGNLSQWAAAMRLVARETSVWCKMSGLVTEATANWQVDDIRPYVDVLLEEFGEGRLMWGSDWPVLTRASSYDRWCEATEELLAGCGSLQQDRILGTNAMSFYKLRDPIGAA